MYYTDIVYISSILWKRLSKACLSLKPDCFKRNKGFDCQPELSNDPKQFGYRLNDSTMSTIDA